MRKLKFKVWDKNKRKFIPSDVWAIVMTDFGAFGIMTKDWEDYKEGEYLYEQSQVPIQYTGMKDKNGEEIYDGHVLSWNSRNPFSRGEYRTASVRYVQAQYWCKGSVGVYLAELLANEKCKIAGNIYENPELAIH